MKIYTKTGDGGDTSLFGGERVSKDSARIAAYGSVDELNAHLGVVRAIKPPESIDKLLARIQQELFVLGADLSAPRSSELKNVRRLEDYQSEDLEIQIDQFEKELQSLKSFILPTGSPIAAQLHVARTVCRRAERMVVALAHEEDIGLAPIKYLNRLSDFLFVLARYANELEGEKETKWTGGK